jgi:hypothetical protein
MGRTLSFVYAKGFVPAAGLAVQVDAYCDADALDAGVPSVVASGTTDADGRFSIPGADAACELSATLVDPSLESTVWDDDSVEVFPRQEAPRLERPVRVFVRDRAQRPIEKAEVCYSAGGDWCATQTGPGEFVIEKASYSGASIEARAGGYATARKTVDLFDPGDLVFTLGPARDATVTVTGPAPFPTSLRLVVSGDDALRRVITEPGRYEFRGVNSILSPDEKIVARLIAETAEGRAYDVQRAVLDPGASPAEFTLEVVPRRVEFVIEGYDEFVRERGWSPKPIHDDEARMQTVAWHAVHLSCPGQERPQRLLIDLPRFKAPAATTVVIDEYAPAGPCDVGLYGSGTRELIPEYETATVDPPGVVSLRRRR